MPKPKNKPETARLSVSKPHASVLRVTQLSIQCLNQGQTSPPIRLSFKANSLVTRKLPECWCPAHRALSHPARDPTRIQTAPDTFRFPFAGTRVRNGPLPHSRGNTLLRRLPSHRNKSTCCRGPRLDTPVSQTPASATLSTSSSA